MKKTLFYPRLAWDGIRKNRRMAFPYILTCICMISMFYILTFLASPSTVELLPKGGSMAQIIMTLGSVVIAVFSMIFLYYTNSFLIRRRAGEFGLYNVLGMCKRNLVRIITLESLITSAISLFFGLFVGITLSKLAELGLIKFIGGTVNYTLRIDLKCVRYTVIVFFVIFAIIWLSSVIRVNKSSAVSLLKSDKAGEKPPKANGFLGILGAVILGLAYYIAVNVSDNPIDAVLWFFGAVIMVIIATYLLMIAGSVLLCRILQKNKKYYYNPRHFVSVSSMVYRMKRNGAGLASIAIIATMVLVMISSASCLWFGTGDMLATRYPGDVNYRIKYDRINGVDEDKLDVLRNAVKEFDALSSSETTVTCDIPFADATGRWENGSVDLRESADSVMISRLREIIFIPLSVYNGSNGQNVTLKEGEALFFTAECSLSSDRLDLILADHTVTYSLIKGDRSRFREYDYLRNTVPKIILVVPDLKAAVASLEVAGGGSGIESIFWKYCLDIVNSPLSDEEYAEGLKNRLKGIMLSDNADRGFVYTITEVRDIDREDFIESTGSIFFIGIVLSVVFIFAAVLIIYYKQVSEGYEDCKRFEVMRKVGMTGKEIKNSINSQLLVVFFIPLAFAGLHLAFAFPMISKMLGLFGLFNIGLFMLTTLISFTVFAVFYASVYKVTSNVYYNIVSGAE